MRRRALFTVVVVLVAVGIGTAGCRRSGQADDGSALPSGTAGRSDGPAAGTSERTVTVDGRQRTYRVYVPSSVAGRTGLPVVVALHGGGGNGAQFEQQSRLNTVADRAGFVAVYPDGSGRTNLLTWNAGSCCAYARDNGVDDVTFVAALLDALVAQSHTDPGRVYVTGFSNGAMLTYRLACELADRITAIAPVAGAINVDTCEPSRALPVLILHGTEDQAVPYGGGPPSKELVPGAGSWQNRSVPYAVEFWTGRDQCPATPTESRDGATVRTTYAPCVEGVEVAMYTIEGGGHAWPGGAKVRDQADDAAPEPDASSVIWDFFARFPAR